MSESDAQREFAPYRQSLGTDWVADDDLLQRWLAQPPLDEAARNFVVRMGRDVATRLRTHADHVERPENLPRLAKPVGRPATAEDIELPQETQQALADIHGSGLWRKDMDERARYASVFLLAQNGEFGVMCSLACTDGLRHALRTLGSRPRDRSILRALEEATPQAWLHGAQFVTEIQGGSDAATSQVAAHPSVEASYTLEGQKWFCSNPTADYWLVTARPEGAPPGGRGVALFLVPRRLEGSPNGYVVERLKDKVGTRALATAEIRFKGARAWPLGPLDAGLRNMVAIVLTTSRVHNTLASAALLHSAAREASAYTRFRSAFGQPVAGHPLPAASLRRIEEASRLTEAGAFALVDEWRAARANPDDAKHAAGVRILVSLAKAVTARRATTLVYEAMMLFGGNGIEERFSPLPRLWRDAAILETWEGPYTLLLMQALEDVVRFGAAEREAEFLRYLVGTDERALVDELAHVLRQPQAPANVERWGNLAPRLYARFEEQALSRLTNAPTPPSASFK